MTIRLHKIRYLLVLAFLLSLCKVHSHEVAIDHLNKENQHSLENGIDFLDSKYFNGYDLILDESNISDHPQFSFLDCNKEGYFTVHLIPKTESLRNFWKNDYYNDEDFINYDNEEDKQKIAKQIKNQLNRYQIFAYHIKKENVQPYNGCTFESTWVSQNSSAEIYLYNQESGQWDLKKTIQSDILPPYHDSEFFLSHFPNLFSDSANHSGDGPQTLYEYTHDLNADGILDRIELYANKNEEDPFDKAHFGLPMSIYKGTSEGNFELWDQNDELIFSPENSCIAEGFIRVAIKKNYFTIEQQTCQDNNITVNSFTTFVVENNEIFLHKYGETYFDKANHDRKIPETIYTTKDFVTKNYKDVSVDFIIHLKQKQPLK